MFNINGQINPADSDILDLDDPVQVADICDQYQIMETMLRIVIKSVGSKKSDIEKCLQKYGLRS